MSAEPAPRIVLEVAAEIEAHITRFAGGADTAKGIREWWLKDTRERATPAVVEEALAMLVAAGRMRMLRVPFGAPIYLRADAPAEGQGQ